jgi:hypothetical protein
MAFVAITIGRRQESGTGVSPVTLEAEAPGETPVPPWSPFSSQPFRPRLRLGGFFRVTHSSRINADVLVV